MKRYVIIFINDEVYDIREAYTKEGQLETFDLWCKNLTGFVPTQPCRNFTSTELDGKKTQLLMYPYSR